jgi:hypothetical protein
MSYDDSEPEKNPRIRKILKEAQDRAEWFEHEVEWIEGKANEAGKKLDEGSKWPEQ